MYINKKIILSILTLGVLVAIGSAGTWAVFQDTSTGSAKVTTGNPDLVAVLNGQAYQDFGDIYLPHLVPGDFGYMNLGEIQNAGTAGGDLYITVPPYDGVDTNLKIYACDVNGNIIGGSANLAQGGEVKIGSMGAKDKNTGNTKFPVKIYFEYHDTGAVQPGNGVNYNFATTLSLRTVGHDFGTINKANDFYNNN
jgi:predicted ribosomally synthesized peptide with SipW-like signal peptide